MPSKAWASFRPPEWVDREAFLFCGADPAWTPEKEQRRAADPDAAPGRCSLCGGEGKVELGDPVTRTMFEVYLQVAIEPGDHGVCARCGRYGLQHLVDSSPAPFGKAQRQETPAAAEKPAKGTTTDRPAKALPPTSSGELVVVCHEHEDCVRRGDVHVPAKFAGLLAEA